MPTVALGLVVGKFEFIESRSEDDEIPIRVYAPKGKDQQGQFTLSVAARAIPYYQDYFSCPFPIQKLDFVAVPESLGPVASYGIITARENQLLANENASLLDKQRIAFVVCENVAKQWVDNLVSHS